MNKPDFTNKKLESCNGFEEPCENTEAEWGHMGTRYVNERSNWAYLCKECRIICGDYWTDMFSDYYSLVL